MLRDALLQLLHALLVPSTAATSEGAAHAAAVNGAAFIRVGGIQLAVALVAGEVACHPERINAPVCELLLGAQ